MTLNAVIALILRFFSPNSTDFQADYITVVEDRPIMSVKYCLLSPSSSLLLLAKNITHPAARSLCDSWASCKLQCWAGINHVIKSTFKPSFILFILITLSMSGTVCHLDYCKFVNAHCIQVIFQLRPMWCGAIK